MITATASSLTMRRDWRDVAHIFWPQEFRHGA
jgi:hypothetical protein